MTESREQDWLLPPNLFPFAGVNLLPLFFFFFLLDLLRGLYWVTRRCQSCERNTPDLTVHDLYLGMSFFFLHSYSSKSHLHFTRIYKKTSSPKIQLLQLTNEILTKSFKIILIKILLFIIAQWHSQKTLEKKNCNSLRNSRKILKRIVIPAKTTHIHTHAIQSANKLACERVLSLLE